MNGATASRGVPVYRPALLVLIAPTHRGWLGWVDMDPDGLPSHTQ